MISENYNDPEFCENNSDPDQTAPVCHTVSIIRTHNFIENPRFFRMITAECLVSNYSKEFYSTVNLIIFMAIYFVAFC